MSTHFLDIKGKIADLEAILKEYESQLRTAEWNGNDGEVRRFSRLIEETEN